MKRKLKLPKARNFILAAVILALVTGALVYIFNAAKVYTCKMSFSADEIGDSRLSYKIEDETVARVRSVEKRHTDDGMTEIVFTLEGVKGGKTDFEAQYLVDETVRDYLDAKLLVTPMGAVFDTESDSFTGCEILMPLNMAIMLAVTVVMMISFVEKYRTGSFSYSMVAAGGVILYLLGSLLLGALALLLRLIDPSVGVNTLKDIGGMMTSCALFFSIVCFPAVLILSIAVSISNIQLVRHEGFRLVNVLGIAFGFVFIAGSIFVFMMSSRDFQGSVFEHTVFSSVNAVLEYAFCYFECMLLSVIICSVLATRYKTAPDRDYIIILGCAIRNDGTPTPILRGRIDRALDFERKQFESTGKHAKFVPSGGQGGDEVVSEAECMKRYLMEQGVPEEQILPEDKSVNTFQNMQFSKRVIEQDAESLENANIAFSTTNYHVFRGYILAKKLGMKVRGLSSKTKLYFFPNAFVREFIGLLWEEKFNHLIVMLLIILCFVGLVIISVN